MPFRPLARGAGPCRTRLSAALRRSGLGAGPRRTRLSAALRRSGLGAGPRRTRRPRRSVGPGWARARAGTACPRRSVGPGWARFRAGTGWPRFAVRPGRALERVGVRWLRRARLTFADRCTCGRWPQYVASLQPAPHRPVLAPFFPLASARSFGPFTGAGGGVRPSRSGGSIRPGGGGRFLRGHCAVGRAYPVRRGQRALLLRRPCRAGRRCGAYPFCAAGRDGQDDAGSPEVNVHHDGNGLGVRQAGEQRQVRLGQAGPVVGLGSDGYHVHTGHSGLRASIPVEILVAARARAQVPGEWSRAPVIGGGSGWHAIKLQAQLALCTNRRVAHKLPLLYRCRSARPGVAAGRRQSKMSDLPCTFEQTSNRD